MGRENEKPKPNRTEPYIRWSKWRTDPAHRIMGFLIAFSVLAGVMVVADVIVCQTIPIFTSSPMIVDIVQLLGTKEADRGRQKVKPEIKEEPKEEPAEKPDPEPQPQPQPVPEPVPQPQPEPPKVVEKVEPGPPTENPDKKSPAIIAVKGDGGNAGGGASYGNRSPEARGGALQRFGGDGQTENSVQLGLEWLAKHQNDDGSWSRTDFDKKCVGTKKCPGGGKQEFLPCDVGITGLALLAFAGNNNTHLDGPYKDVVAKGVKYLLSQQVSNGRFGNIPRDANQYMMYNHGIAAFALAEICTLSKDETLKPALEKAAAFIIQSQQQSGGWDYTDVKGSRWDTSVTGWQVMALKSLQAAGVQIPANTIYKMVRFFDTATQQTGDVIYANAEPGRGRLGQGIAAVGMTSERFLGLPANTIAAQRQTQIFLQNLPEWSKLQKQGHDTIYYWYYATIGMFQVGGKAWDQWNTSMKKAILVQQRHGGCMEGSWDPPANQWADIGGRVYTTALCVLNLEIYYRYLPLLDAGSMHADEALAEIARGKNSDALEALKLLGHFKNEFARRTLVDLASGEDRQLALEAAVILAANKDQAAIGPLLDELKNKEWFVRHRALKALVPMMGNDLVPVFIDSLNDPMPTVAKLADASLRQFSNTSFSFDAEAPAAEKAKAIEKWKQWWAAQERAGAADNKVVWLIISVRADQGLVAFNTVKPNLVTPGEKFNVYRKGKFVGRINVISSQGDISIGKIIPDFTVDEIKESDVVKPGP